MELNNLTAISPVDGRYRNKTEVFSKYFSEFALIRYRVLVEVEYFIALSELPLEQLKGIDKKAYKQLRQLYLNFNLEGQFIESNIPFQTATNLNPLGKSSGYQHLWEIGRGMSKESSSYSTWMNNNRFYTITTATEKPTELIFTRLGANDPKFNPVITAEHLKSVGAGTVEVVVG